MKLKSIRIELEDEANAALQGYIWAYGDEMEGLLNAQRWLNQYIAEIHNPTAKAVSASKPIIHD